MQVLLCSIISQHERQVNDLTSQTDGELIGADVKEAPVGPDVAIYVSRRVGSCKPTCY